MVDWTPLTDVLHETRANALRICGFDNQKKNEQKNTECCFFFVISVRDNSVILFIFALRKSEASSSKFFFDFLPAVLLLFFFSTDSALYQSVSFYVFCKFNNMNQKNQQMLINWSSELQESQHQTVHIQRVLKITNLNVINICKKNLLFKEIIAAERLISIIILISTSNKMQLTLEKLQYICTFLKARMYWIVQESI